MPEPGARLTLTVERFAAQGRGIARVDGKAVLVERGVAGETVEAEVVQEEQRFSIARVVSVTSPSADRVPPQCPHFEACGGCDWQHVRYPAQVALKRQAVQEQLERIGHLTPPIGWEITPAAEPLEYRDKLEWVPVATPQGWVAGLHGRRGDPVPIERCWLAPPEYTQVAQLALQALGEAARGGKPSGKPPLGVTRLTVQGGQSVNGAPSLALTLHLHSGRDVDAAQAQGSNVLKTVQAHVSALSTVALAVGGDEERPGGLRVVAGDGVLYKQVGTLRYPVPVDAFFQVHPAQAELLVAYVLAEIARLLPPEGAPRVLDLFCGAGLFTLPLLRAGYTVMGAEMSRSAIRAAERAAKLAALNASVFRVLDLDKPQALRELVRDAGHPAAVLLDPPRRGLSPRLTTDLAATGPALLVYVSCDAGTFARDARKLKERYELAALRGFDLFPQTHHLEVVGTFLRK